MDKVYMNIPEYIRTEVTQLRFVEMKVVRSVKKARSFNMRKYQWRSPVQTEHGANMTEVKINR